MQARELSFGLLTRVDIGGTIRRDFSDEQQLVHFTLGDLRGGLLTLDEGGVYYERRAKNVSHEESVGDSRVQEQKVINYRVLELCCTRRIELAEKK